MNYAKHWAKIFQGRKRTPRLVADVGAGRGEICAMLSMGAIPCVGIDPSPGAKNLFPRTMKAWANKLNYLFYNLNSSDGLRKMMYLDMFPDTIIMCESIEHIRTDEFVATWVLIKQMLTKTGGLFIITNRLKFHPIAPDNTGYDHITRIDDNLYDTLAQDALETIVRERAHLVLRC
jgi:2-polyprenyl-3-methyl-5-hydroxy-6-metoxy-1,4-benzoquinol methylase